MFNCRKPKCDQYKNAINCVALYICWVGIWLSISGFGYLDAEIYCIPARLSEQRSSCCNSPHSCQLNLLDLTPFYIPRADCFSNQAQTKIVLLNGLLPSQKNSTPSVSMLLSLNEPSCSREKARDFSVALLWVIIFYVKIANDYYPSHWL